VEPRAASVCAGFAPPSPFRSPGRQDDAAVSVRSATRQSRRPILDEPLKEGEAGRETAVWRRLLLGRGRVFQKMTGRQPGPLRLFGRNQESAQ